MYFKRDAPKGTKAQVVKVVKALQEQFPGTIEEAVLPKVRELSEPNPSPRRKKRKRDVVHAGNETDDGSDGGGSGEEGMHVDSDEEDAVAAAWKFN